MKLYKITGTGRNGKRFSPIYTRKPHNYNIWQGSLWEVLKEATETSKERLRLVSRYY